MPIDVSNPNALKVSGWLSLIICAVFAVLSRGSYNSVEAAISASAFVGSVLCLLCARRAKRPFRHGDTKAGKMRGGANEP